MLQLKLSATSLTKKRKVAPVTQVGLRWQTETCQTLLSIAQRRLTVSPEEAHHGPLDVVIATRIREDMEMKH